jgi:hypothetical protein
MVKRRVGVQYSPSYAGARAPGAHDDVMRVLEEEVMREAQPDRRGVWDTKGMGVQ